MSAPLVNILGFAAATFTTVAFVPQVWKTWRERSTKDISLSTFAMFSLGVFLWLVYGLLVEAWPVIIANAVTLVLSSVILFFKLRYR